MTPKEECEELFNFLILFARDQLKKYGEFYPFGAVLQNKDDITATAFYDDNDFPDCTEVIRFLTEAHRKDAENGEINASGICWNAKVHLKNGVYSDAIIISLEHREDYSVIMGQSYRFEKKGLHLGDVFALKGRHDIF